MDYIWANAAAMRCWRVGRYGHVELGGGEYLVSAPLVVPMFYGNFYVSVSTLAAEPPHQRGGWKGFAGRRKVGHGVGEIRVD